MAVARFHAIDDGKDVMSDYSEGYLDGASASLQKTISLIESQLDGSVLKTGSPRADLHKAIVNLVHDWTQYGFYLGHRESYRALREGAEIPATLNYCEKGWTVIDNETLDLDLTSRIRRV